MKNVYLIILCACLLACSHSDTLTLLYTNDTHSQVLPKDNGQGGYARRMGWIAQEREKDPNLLLLDAGDFSQGTTFFNFFHGRVEVDALNKMGYDAITLGNHEFDNGVDTLAMILKKARFEVVSANYDVQGTPLQGIVKPYTLFWRNGLLVGVFGIGCSPEGLIDDRRFSPVRYKEPYECAQRVADILKNKWHCDLVVCLSHQGTYPPTVGAFSDVEMVQQTRNIDIIIGGHTHHVYQNLQVENIDGKPVTLVQSGRSGTRIGKLELKIERNEANN